MSLTIVPALLLAAATLPASDRVALDAEVLRIFRPYSNPASTTGSLDDAIYSRETAALIARWRKVTPSDEVDRLSDGDWFCQCQEWDAASFRVTIAEREMVQRDVAQITVRLAIGWGTERDSRMIFQRETGGWKLDDLYFADMPEGFKATLRQTIAEDEALAARKPR